MIGFPLENPVSPDYYGLGQMDVGFDSSGHIKTLTGRERIRHDVLKGILTGRVGDYGTAIPGLIGGKGGSGLEAVASYSVQQFIDAYRASQAATLPDEERISSVRQLVIDRNDSDSSQYLVRLVLNMADGQAISIESTVGK